jgi:hypothetical protein
MLTFTKGMDVGDIDIVIQYCSTCDFLMLMQQFGHAACHPGSEGVRILLVEKKDTAVGQKGKAMSVQPKKEEGDIVMVDEDNPVLDQWIAE